MKSVKNNILAILLLQLFSFANLVYAQMDDLVWLNPDWEIGDERKVKSVSNSKTYVGDQLFSDIKVEADYRIKVTDATPQTFTLLYVQEIGDLDFQQESGDVIVENIMTAMTKALEQSMANYEVSILFDRNEGLATAVLDEDKLHQHVRSATIAILEVFMGDTIDSSVKKEALQTIETQLINSKAEITQSIINSVNYIFQVYSTAFLPENTYNQSIMVYDINALGVFGAEEFPATITVTSFEANNNLIINSKLDYDQNFLLTQMKARNKEMAHLNPEDMIIKETSDYTIDLKNTWIKRHVSHTLLEIPGFKFEEHSTLIFER